MEQILDPASYFNKASLPLVSAFYSYQVYEQKRILIKM